MEKKVYIRHVCKRCNQQFFQKSALDRHIARKKKCVKQPISEIVLAECKCACGNQFQNPAGLRRHEKRCVDSEFSKAKMKGYMSGNIDATGNKDCVMVGNNNGGTVNGNNCNTTTNIAKTANVTINSNIIIVPYTREFGIDRLSRAEQEVIMDITENPHLSLFQFVHCDTSRTSYHNIFGTPDMIPNIWVHDGTSWTKEKISYVIKEILQKQRNDLKNFLYDGHLKIDAKIQVYIQQHIDLLDKTNATSKEEIEKYTENLHMLHGCIQQMLMDKISVIAPTFSKTKDDSLFNGVTTLFGDLDNSDDSDDSYDSDNINSQINKAVNGNKNTGKKNKLSVVLGANRKKKSDVQSDASEQLSEEIVVQIGKNMGKKKKSSVVLGANRKKKKSDVQSDASEQSSDDPDDSEDSDDPDDSDDSDDSDEPIVQFDKIVGGKKKVIRCLGR